MKIVHFCFGMTPDFGGRPFGLSHYLAVRSAWEVLRPGIMFLHCAHEPAGPWWELARPLLTVHRVRPVAGIYGFPAAHPAHRADIVRLAALLALGGIYLDLDVLVVRPFDALPAAPFAAALEARADGAVVGISNAVLTAEPGSRFARLCLEGHDPARSLWGGFRSRGRDEHYTEYSVHYPCLLARLCPQLIRVLPAETFLWISWDEKSLHRLFSQDVPVPLGVLALHLWESHAWPLYLSNLNGEDVARRDTTFNRLARRFLPQIPPTPGALTAPTPALQTGLEEMERICQAADFIAESHRPPRGPADLVKRKLRALAGRARQEWLLPVRCQVERLDRRVQGLEERDGVPPADPGPGPAPLIRCGPGDGSEALAAGRPPRTGAPITYIIATGAEPAAAGWLATRPGARGVWITPSLARAKTLAEWSARTGRLCRALHSATPPHEWSALVADAALPAEPAVLVLAGTGREFWQWRAMERIRAERVLVICNPLLPPESTLAVPPEAAETASGLAWGASRGAFVELAATRGLVLATASADGQFLLFVRGEEAGAEKFSPPPALESVTIRTVSGQTLEISRGDALKLLAGVPLINTRSGEPGGLKGDEKAGHGF